MRHQDPFHYLSKYPRPLRTPQPSPIALIGLGLLAGGLVYLLVGW